METLINDGRFKKGLTPWNKGKKGIRMSPDTEFKTGENVGEKSPSWKGGVQQAKADCTYLWDGANKRIRRPKKVYEDAYGPIPKGFVIIHLDGNKHNDLLSNLEAISRAELLRRNRTK